MKIRKVFESEIYTKIDRFEINSTRYIPKTEMDIILDKFPLIRKPISTPSKVNPSGITNPFKLIIGKGYNRKDIEVNVDTDEWYYLRIYDRSSETTFGNAHMSKFKCDQLDGLLDCIQKEIIDKYEDENQEGV